MLCIQVRSMFVHLGRVQIAVQSKPWSYPHLKLKPSKHQCAESVQVEILFGLTYYAQ